MDVHLRSIAESLSDPPANALEALHALRRAAEKDQYGQHRTVDDPSRADVILFVESHRDNAPTGPYFEHLRRDPVYRRFRDRTLVHSGMDAIVPLVPGIFPSIERDRYLHSRTRPGAYLGTKNEAIDAVAPAPMHEPRWLASFVGTVGRKKSLRQRLVSLNDERMMLDDTTSRFVGALRQHDDATVAHLKQHYVDVARDSCFILCPRGSGASSIRLFEAMQLGRAPVIISDQWVPPEGPDWDALSVRAPEHDLDALPDLLRAHEADAEAMGRRARQAWDTFFSEQSIFHTTCEACASLLEHDRWAASLDALRARMQLLRPPHVRYSLRRIKQRLRPH